MRRVTLVRVYPNDIGAIIRKWDWYDCFKVRQIQLLPSDTDTIIPKWVWYECSQMTLVRLFPSDTGMIFSQVRLAPLFPNETRTIFPKWHCHNCSQVTLVQLLLSGFLLSNLYFVWHFVLWHNSSLVSFIWEQLCHVSGLWHMIRSKKSSILMTHLE